jgi:hypothetical protein
MNPKRRVELLAEHLYRNDARHLKIVSKEVVYSLPFHELDCDRQEDYRNEARGILAWIDAEAPTPR